MAKEKVEKKNDEIKMETRGIGEIRAVDDQGVIEAYLTKFGSIDEYRSTFKEGSFKKTFQERGNKIKLIWNHDVLIGKVIEAREDKYGPFVRGQINLDTQAGQEAYAHCKAGDVDAFSFGFNVIQDKWVDGIRHISEVRCMECGPVIFPANEMAEIVSVREKDEERNVDFDQTVIEDQLRRMGSDLLQSLDMTLYDIWWSQNSEGQDVVAQVDAAIQAFHGAYVEWASNYINQFKGQRSVPGIGKIATALFEHSNGDLDEIAKNTSLTINELRGLRENNLLPMESRGKLAELPESIQKAHQTTRNEFIAKLCDELRMGGFSDAERSRFKGLLGVENSEPSHDDFLSTIGEIVKLRESLTKEN